MPSRGSPASKTVIRRETGQGPPVKQAGRGRVRPCHRYAGFLAAIRADAVAGSHRDYYGKEQLCVERINRRAVRREGPGGSFLLLGVRDAAGQPHSGALWGVVGQVRLRIQTPDHDISREIPFGGPLPILPVAACR